MVAGVPDLRAPSLRLGNRVALSERGQRQAGKQSLGRFQCQMNGVVGERRDLQRQPGSTPRRMLGDSIAMKVLFAVDGSSGSFDAVAQVGPLLNPAEDQVALYCAPPDTSRLSSGASPEVLGRARQGLVVKPANSL